MMNGDNNKDMSNEDMVLNPYDTTFGKLLNKGPIETKLIRYLATAGNNLNYEYRESDDCDIAFITGKNDEEKELPMFEHPMVVINHRGNKVVVTDMRRYVKPVDSELYNMDDIIKDGSGYTFNVLRTLVTADMESGIYGTFKALDKAIVGSFGYTIADSINASITLTPVEKVTIEIIAQHYMNMLFVNGEVSIEDVNTSIVKISKSRLSLPMKHDVVANIVSKLKHDVSTMQDLVDNIKNGLLSEKTTLIDINTLVNMLSNTWSGNGGTESVLMAIENIPSWIAIVYAASSNKTYKRTRISMILDKYKSKIKLPEFIKSMELYINDKKD